MPIPTEAAVELLQKTFSSLEKGMSETDAGKSLAGLIKNEFIPTYGKAIDMETQAASRLPQHLQPAPMDVASRAKNVATSHTFGKNYELAAAHVAAVATQPGLNPAQVAMRQQSLADHLHMFLHDTVESTPRLGAFSASKRAINLNKNYDLAHIHIGDTPESLTSQKAPLYRPPGKIERGVNAIARYSIAPAIAIPHLGTALNYSISTPLDVLANGMADFIANPQAARQAAIDSGAMQQTMFDSYSTRWYASKGMVAKVTGSPMIGQIVAKATHQPGFNWTRETQIAAGAAFGKRNVEKFAEQLANNPTDKRAIYELKDMGLTPADILTKRYNSGPNRYGVNLTPDDYSKAIYHYIDSKIFLDNKFGRAYYSRQNPLWRMATMYHGYVTSQARFLGKELMKAAWKGGDLTLIPQAFATLGVMFPMAGLALKSLEMTARGQWSESHPIQDEENFLATPAKLVEARSFDEFKEAITPMMDGWSHLGAFGVMNSVSNSILRHELANQVIGPIGNVAVNLLSDATVGAVRSAEGHTGSFKPFERDVLEDAIGDNLGKILAHRFLPTATEQRSRNPKLSFRHKGFKSFKAMANQ